MSVYVSSVSVFILWVYICLNNINMMIRLREPDRFYGCNVKMFRHKYTHANTHADTNICITIIAVFMSFIQAFTSIKFEFHSIRIGFTMLCVFFDIRLNLIWIYIAYTHQINFIWTIHRSKFFEWRPVVHCWLRHTEYVLCVHCISK